MPGLKTNLKSTVICINFALVNWKTKPSNLHCKMLFPLWTVCIVAFFCLLWLSIYWDFHVRAGSKPFVFFFEFCWNNCREKKKKVIYSIRFQLQTAFFSCVLQYSSHWCLTTTLKKNQTMLDGQKCSCISDHFIRCYSSHICLKHATALLEDQTL